MSTTTLSPHWHFDNSYATLPEGFFSPQPPVAVAAPQLVVLNHALAEQLGLDFSGSDTATLSAIFGGNTLPTGAKPIAQAYAGHQFGNFTMLGDGRAVLLGEHLTPRGQRFDIQLKGSGQTPYSRRGDGRATLSAMLREYIISEAMHHLGIRTSRSLAVAVTGERVYRERVQAGAVLTRVASSHIRVGTFEYARQFLSDEDLQTFTDYVIKRHYEGLQNTQNAALELLRQVIHRQTDLVADWLRVGFIHGVMNTDNMSIAGETIDYGPCAFMNQYDPQTVFSSIDTYGRYAFGNQPKIAHWNLAVFAGTLLPLIDPDPEKATQLAQEVVNTFPAIFKQKWLKMMAAKLGIADVREEDRALIDSLLEWMQAYKADYTNTFWHLSTDHWTPTDHYATASFAEWHGQWQQRVAQAEGGMAAAKKLMQTQNPAFIPRNHLVEEALEQATRYDFAKFETLMQVLSNPYHYRPEYASYQLPPPPQTDEMYQTFCGT
ncbi:MAG: YdiU family protein [Spirosomaceae bacterium]|jgi:uncharacterized protein YdiU (UPF0061 family)|nr:YdiU family protein [Spirosomataceae bacterium]